MLIYAATSHKGTREYNEDSINCIESENGYCFVLADGLGGHEHGDVASRLVTDCIVNEFKQNGTISDDFVDNSIYKAQIQLLEEQKKCIPNSQMKSTCVVLITNGQKAIWSNVGDSRLYLFSNNEYLQTEDHSVPWMLMKANEINKDEIRNHDDRSRLLAAIGSEWSKKPYKVDSKDKLEKGNVFLLCSDGLWEHVTEEKMMKLLAKSKSPEQWLNKMSKIVERKSIISKTDNYSAIAVWIC